MCDLFVTSLEILSENLVTGNQFRVSKDHSSLFQRFLMMLYYHDHGPVWMFVLKSF